MLLQEGRARSCTARCCKHWAIIQITVVTVTILRTQEPSQKTSLARYSSATNITVTQVLSTYFTYTAIPWLLLSAFSVGILAFALFFCIFHSFAPRGREPEYLVATPSTDALFSSIQMRALSEPLLSAFMPNHSLWPGSGFMWYKCERKHLWPFFPP